MGWLTKLLSPPRRDRYTVACGCVIEADTKSLVRLGMLGATQIPVTIKIPCELHQP